MAKSISKAQADAEAEGFDYGGSGRDEFEPKASLSKLYQKAGELADAAALNLVKADRVATGKGAESITVLNPERVGKTIKIDITMLYYLQFIDQGVKGTKKGNGKYAFKSQYPGKKMMQEIRKWLIREGLKGKTGGQGKPITKREERRKSITETSTRVAYAIATSVKQKGIKASKFMDNAIKTTRKSIKQDMGAAFKIDVIATLPKKLN